MISVEGPSERKFVEQVLMPHLLDFKVQVANPQDMKGNISVDRVSNRLNILIHHYDYVTTLYDFYGFEQKSAGETKKSLELKIKNRITCKQQHKIIPYIQMYEFEALLFSDSQIMAQVLGIKESWANNILKQFKNNPEAINNSKETAPSKRIEKQYSYRKTTNAPNILSQIRLSKIRKKCTGFNTWINKLEDLDN